MHTLLIVITVVSVVVATGLAVVIARLLREDRERSNARVAALALLAAGPADSDDVEPAPVTQVWRPASPGAAAHTMWSGNEQPADLALRGAGDEAGPGLFAERETASPWGRRFAVIGTLSAVLAAMLLAATLAGRHTERARASASAVAPAAAPLELLELRHARDPQSLTISGVIRNPAGTAPVSHLVATAFVFGPDGTFLTSSRAPVRRSTLASGEESPFVVAIPVNGAVSRYRIGFRTEDGQVVAHVDKRTADTFASKQEQP